MIMRQQKERLTAVVIQTVLRPYGLFSTVFLFNTERFDVKSNKN